MVGATQREEGDAGSFRITSPPLKPRGDEADTNSPPCNDRAPGMKRLAGSYGSQRIPLTATSEGRLRQEPRGNGKHPSRNKKEVRARRPGRASNRDRIRRRRSFTPATPPIQP
jgi:hypothetical protein